MWTFRLTNWLFREANKLSYGEASKCIAIIAIAYTFMYDETIERH